MTKGKTWKTECYGCSCPYCLNKDCPVPCKAKYVCDTPVTKCDNFKPLRIG